MPSPIEVLAMSEWVKPNGNRIEVNDLPATVKYVTSLGWTRETQNESPIDTMNKDELEEYAREHGLEIDKRRSIESLRNEVRAIE